MTDTKHTPTPWMVEGAVVVDSELFEIATTADSEFTHTIDRANAAHIVKCVNMHDELVEVLQWIADNSMCEGAVFASTESLKKAGAI